MSVVRRRLGGNRLRGGVVLAWHFPRGHRRFDDRPHRLAGDAIERVEIRLLGRHRHGLDGLAVDRDLGKDRRARDVHIPDAVVHELVVPLPLSGLEIDSHQALAKQAGTGTMAAVVIAGRHFDGQVREAELFVN